MTHDRWPKITIQFPPSFTLRDFADALKLPPEAVIEVETNGLGAVLLRELSARIPGNWVGANVANRPVVEASDDERFAARSRVVEKCIERGLGLDAMVAFLDLLERGVNK